MSDLLLPAPTPDSVTEFCQSVFSKHSHQWPIQEDILADEFLLYANLTFIPGSGDFSQVCQERLGISIHYSALPDGMRGFNGSYDGKREIWISTNQDYSGARLHTLLHELREILENEFRALGHRIVNDSNIEQRAEEFASHVQINAAHQVLPVVLENASAIERKWLRIGAYILIFLGALAYTMSCTLIAQIEDSFAELRSRT